MIVSLIAAMDEQRGIGVEGRLPWRLSTDLKRFRHLTMGHHLIMGRKTYLSIGKPLPGRINIVLSRQSGLTLDGVIVMSSLSEALVYAERSGESEVFIIGGGDVFHQTIHLADRLYITNIHAVTEADTFFPLLDESWRVVFTQEVPEDERNQYASTFCIYQRT